MKVKAMIVDPKDGVREEEIEATLETFQQIVGGYIEALPLPPYGEAQGVTAYGNEEAKLENLPWNPIATWLLFPQSPPPDVVAGPIVLVGWDPGKDEYHDLPEAMAKLVHVLGAALEPRMMVTDWPEHDA